MLQSESKKSMYFWFVKEINVSDRDIKFLVDVCVGNKVEVWLDLQGFDTKAVRDLDPRMTDNEILQMVD